MHWWCDTRSHQCEGGAEYSQRSDWMTIRYEELETGRENKDQPVRDFSIKHETRTVGWQKRRELGSDERDRGKNEITLSVLLPWRGKFNPRVNVL